MRVAFWGTPSFALPALRALSDEGHDIVAVVTQPDRPAGRGQRSAPGPVKRYAVDGMIDVLQPECPTDEAFLSRLRDLKPEISVVVAYGHILKPEVLELPTLGSLNIHASLLPELRGAAPIHWAIIHGYQTTGVTIMRMEAGLDSGPILRQVEEPIRVDESMQNLAGRLAEVGAEALISTLALLEEGPVVEQVQDHSRATYAPKLSREIARLDWTLPALEVARWIRGLDGVPGAWSLQNGGEPVKFFSPRIEVRSGTPGEVIEVDDEMGILVGAGHEAVRVREVQPAGKRRMDAGEWVRGRGVRVGDRFA
ncbi:MAG: methionyl-tRNA formyltransferase [Gemmatimonadota bacterium]|jgi:methionyl-tRNA formyltransferase|nr:methionyl-tRNA formyltransferase [Gemmatimonadota bacterium]